jgi:hypothetical protein
MCLCRHPRATEDGRNDLFDDEVLALVCLYCLAVELPVVLLQVAGVIMALLNIIDLKAHLQRILLINFIKRSLFRSYND